MMTRADLWNTVAAFRADTRGSTAMIFGISVVPILLLVASGIDYSRAITQKAQLQQATDATALAITKSLTTSYTQASLLAQANAFLAGASQDPNATITSGPTVSSTNTSLCITTKTTSKATMMQVAVGMKFLPPTTLTVSGNSCTKINDVTYEIALVLDTSGSMTEGTSGTTKISSLQTAANQLVSTMMPANVSPPRSTISIVPFSMAVNVGSGYRGASWIDNNGQSSIAGQNYLLPQNLPNGAFFPTNRFALFDAMGQTWGGCLEERPGDYLTSDAPATLNNGDSLYEPYLYPDEYSNSNNNQLMSQYGITAVNNYLKSQSGGSCQPNDLYAQADAKNSRTPVYNAVLNSSLPRGDTQTMVCKYNSKTNTRALNYLGQQGWTTGPNLMCDSQPLTTLTNSKSTLTSQINAMNAKGSTNIFSGVMWGWRTLSPNGPFNTQTTGTGSIGPQNAKAYTLSSSGTTATTNVKVMILMTDGFNNWLSTLSGYGNNLSSYSPMGFYENSRLGATTTSNWRSVMDATTLQACSNAKATGIQIYTVGFSIPSDPIDSAGLTLLQNCATKTSMAYIAQDGSQLITTFQSIAQQMSGLRLTH